jgi:hypothetical protein
MIFGGRANPILLRLISRGVGYVIWRRLDAAGLADVDAAMADLAADEDVRSEAAMRR